MTKRLYCPICLNDTMTICKRGLIHLSVNGRSRDTGRFLFNIETQDHDEILEEFENKVEDFLKWYSNFQNIEPINKIEVYSNDFICESGCKIPIDKTFTILDVLFTHQEAYSAVEKIAQKYKMKVELITS